MLIAAGSTPMLLQTLLLSYPALIELAAFVLLAAASLWSRHIWRGLQARVLGLPDGR